MKKNKSKLPTSQESLASISQSLREINQSLRAIADALVDNRGDNALASMTEALFDIAEYGGSGEMPKDYYGWRHGRERDTEKEG